GVVGIWGPRPPSVGRGGGIDTHGSLNGISAAPVVGAALMCHSIGVRGALPLTRESERSM
ncbi:hypothetical protein, partial [Rhodococcus sp. BP-241]|uniref:hypothetical protein n=1 Tax=Rhodococcus sp. BP-241 TaxID=2739441 RepID=UPI001C9A8153